jgi:rRNA processing protein Gar1
METKRTECVKRTPKDIGTLRNSVLLKGPEQIGKKTTCSIVAGGAAAPYAVVQHENLQYHHTEGQAKYIESVILESRSSIGDEIAALVRF